MTRFSQDLKERLRTSNTRSERLKREIEQMKRISSDSNTGLHSRLSTLEEQCDDLKEHNLILEKVKKCKITKNLRKSRN